MAQTSVFPVRTISSPAPVPNGFRDPIHAGPPVILKEGGTFLVADARGDITGEHGSGLYEHDTRYLSRFVLTINGHRPVVGTSTRPGPAVVSMRASVAERRNDVGCLRVHRSAVVDDALHVNVMLRNPASQPRRVRVTLTMAADFRDMFAVRGFYAGKRRGTVQSPELAERHVRFRYETLDGLPLWTDVRANHAPLRTAMMRSGHHGQTPGVRWTFAITVPAGGREEISFLVAPGRATEAAADRSIAASLRTARTLAHQWTDEIAAIETDNAAFNRLLRRSAGDLRSLLTPCAAGEVAAAGIPWFVAPFGRDSCITALESLMLTPRFAVGALRALAAHQGTAVNPARDEEPGKILHEIRVGELSRAGILPFSTYYGSVDSTPLFVMLFAQTMRWLDADALYDDLLPHVRRALEWCDLWGDADGDGYVEFGRYAPNGVANQGWKDSHDSLHHPDGSDVLRPVALAEVQAYVYAAKAWLADIVEQRDDLLWAAQLRVEAAELAAQFERDFWLPDEGCYAYALDGAKRPVRTVVSNVGHLLYCDLVRGDKAAIVAERLLKPDMLSGWGVRTLSSDAVRYDPDSYHNGSIWPHDNALTALGMRRAGCAGAATEVASQVIAAGLAQPLSRIPELYAGYARDVATVAPVPYPVSCSPQAWSAASAFAFLQAMIGLDVDGRTGEIACTPHLPSWLSFVRVRGLRFGQTRADITITRDGPAAYRVAIAHADGVRTEYSVPSAQA
ncbi:MAG: amylo-alpha-1,6-glucosidase [Chloroflexota bacterium]|nr:amylo-alpha-1,6-glucosidase [Chloroflexota bacterium]